MIYRSTYAMVFAAGSRAVKACQSAGGKAAGEWTADSLRRAASWLSLGDRRGGVARPWPGLASKIENAAEHEDRCREAAAKKIAAGGAATNADTTETTGEEHDAALSALDPEHPSNTGL